jgi:hypothetical protein
MPLLPFPINAIAKALRTVVFLTIILSNKDIHTIIHGKGGIPE